VVLKHLDDFSQINLANFLFQLVEILCLPSRVVALVGVSAEQVFPNTTVPLHELLYKFSVSLLLFIEVNELYVHLWLVQFKLLLISRLL